ncbi:MAG: Uma2 family endonuclease, partial [Geopsychrobacter sp.]|nr:Uma2 family endonuclease [Geopsychrobacter sp.]
MKLKTLGRMLPLILWLLLALPLVAGATNKTFSAGSVIIPMDPCWQPNNDPDVDPAFLHAACDYQTPSLRNDQGVFQAYGLVYTLLRQGVPVYWIIDPDKTSRHGIDFTIAGDASHVPVAKYTSDATTISDTDPLTERVISDATLAAHVVEYRGGPFVIRQQDLSAAGQLVLNSYSNVKKHIARIDFTAPVEKVLADLPPKIAVLGQGATDVLQDYLTASGLGNQTNVV